MDVDDEPHEYASAPCLASEMADRPHPFLDDATLATRLNELLEGERAGVRGLMSMKAACTDDPALLALIDQVERDEARFCSMLRRHLLRMGYPASRAIGEFFEKLMRRETLLDRLRLLDRGQSAVVRTLDELLPLVLDRALHQDLVEMRDVHVRNIARCAAWLDGPPPAR